MSSLTSLGASASPWVYLCFVAFVLGLLALDLGVFNRKAHAPSMREAIAWSTVWISLALAFGAVIYFLYEHHALGLGLSVPVVGAAGETYSIGGSEASRLYLTAYLVEKSLSIDNVFVIALIFSSMAIPVAFQHRVLYWGILGALIMRGLMIGIGATVIAEFSWVVYVFGALLAVAALRMAFSKDTLHDPRQSWVVRLLRRLIPLSPNLDGQHLLVRLDGAWHGTPLFVALFVIEATDLMFAVDSIPAVFAVTGDPFIVFTSNIMAILGLRSLYFCLAAAVTQFRYLKTALIAVLLFVGIKMCLVHTAWKVPTEVSLAVIVGLLISGITASLLTRLGTSETPLEEGVIPDAHRRPASLIEVLRLARGFWKSNRTLRRATVLTIGSVVLLIGLVVSPLPGPGLTILGPIGIGILASEFLWARRLARHAVVRERKFRSRIDAFFVRFPRVFILPAVALLWLAASVLSRHAPLPAWIIGSMLIAAATPAAYVLYRWYVARAARRRRRSGSSGQPTAFVCSRPADPSVTHPSKHGSTVVSPVGTPSSTTKEIHLKRIIAKLSFVLGSPVLSYGLLSIGAEGKEHLGGRLVQLAGAFLALIWLTGSFLLLGSFMTRTMGYQAPDRATTTASTELTSRRQKEDDAADM